MKRFYITIYPYQEGSRTRLWYNFSRREILSSNPLKRKKEPLGRFLFSFSHIINKNIKPKNLNVISDFGVLSSENPICGFPAINIGDTLRLSIFRPFRTVTKNLRCSRLYSPERLSRLSGCFDEPRTP